MAVTRITIIRDDDLDHDFLALELVRNVTRATDNLPAMLVLLQIFFVELWAKASNWRDV